MEPESNASTATNNINNTTTTNNLATELSAAIDLGIS